MLDWESGVLGLNSDSKDSDPSASGPVPSGPPLAPWKQERFYSSASRTLFSDEFL